MALPTTGPISMAQIQAEFGGPNYSLSTYYRGAGYTSANNTNVPASGLISLSNFRGAVKVVPGSRSFGVGTTSFTVPIYSQITFDLSAGGGGGGGPAASVNPPLGPGGTGGASYVSSAVAYGGTGGSNGHSLSVTGAPGAHGTATGGNQNITAGGAPGGGGGASYYGQASGGAGGYGARVIRTWYAGEAGAPVPGSVIGVVIGGGGAGAPPNYPGAGNYGGAGGNGYGSASWS